MKKLKILNDKQKFKPISKTKLSYCLKFTENTESENPKIVKTKNGRKMLSLKCSMCNSKK